MVADGLEGRGSADVADRQHGDLVVEIHESFHDDPAGAGTATFLGVVPGGVDVFGFLDGALAVTGGTHDGLDDAGDADRLDGGAEFLIRIGKTVGRRGQAEFFGGQAADAFPVHGQQCGFRRGDYVVAFFFQLDQGRGGDGFHFRDDEIRLFLFNDLAEQGSVQHVDDMAAMGHLHGRGIGITVYGNHFDAIALEFDDDFFSEFAGAEKEGSFSDGAERSSELEHDCFGFRQR